MSARRSIGLGAALALLACPPAASAGTTSAQLIAASAAGTPACLQWAPVGVCFWLTCTPWGCSVRTSIKVRHYAPGLAISTFHDPALHPWTDWGVPVSAAARKGLSALIAQPLVDSAGTRSREARTDKNIKFRDADAIGHPSIVVGLSSFAGTGMLCKQTTNAYRPYLLSLLDGWVWRNYLPIESLYLPSWIPGLREIGTFPLNSWGGVYPRTGHLVQQHDVKASAVIAQRIGDIVTRSGEPHVYNPAPNNSVVDRGSQMVWNPPSLKERAPITGMFQMQYPIPSPACVVFGDNDSITPLSFGDGQSTADSGYVWALWRPYRCCARKGQFFLYSIGY